MQRLSNELARRGHHVEIIHCVDSYHALKAHGPTGDVVDHPNLVIHRLASPVGRLSPFATQQTGYPLFKHAQLNKILAREFDVIHFHNISLIGGPNILKFGHGIKLYTMHEYWLLCPMHLLLRTDGTVCRERHCFACSLQYKRPPQWWRHSPLLEKSLQQLDALIAPSRFSQTLHEASGITLPIHHIPNFGVDDDEPIAIADDISSSPYFLFVGRLEHAKGLQTILPIFRKRPQLRLVIAGEGNYEGELKRLAQASPNIQFLGFQSQKQLKSLYRHAQAVIMPSMWHEVFPLVALEAFQHKTPLLARNLGALREIVTTSEGGWLYDTNLELETILAFVLTHPDERTRRGANGYATYQREWMADAHVKRYFDLLEQLTPKNGAGKLA